MRKNILFTLVIFATMFMFLQSCDNPDPKSDPVKVELLSVKSLSSNISPGDSVEYELKISSEKDITAKNEKKETVLANVPISLFLISKKESDNNNGTMTAQDGTDIPFQYHVDTVKVQIKSGTNTQKITYRMNDKPQINGEPLFLDGEYYATMIIDPNKTIETINHDDGGKKDEMPGEKMYKKTIVSMQKLDENNPHKYSRLSLSTGNILSIVDERDAGKDNGFFHNFIENFPSVDMTMDAMPEYKMGIGTKRDLSVWIVAPNGSVTKIKSAVPDEYNQIKESRSISKDKTLHWSFYHKNSDLTKVTFDCDYFAYMIVGRTFSFPNMWKFDSSVNSWLFSNMSPGKNYNFKFVFTVNPNPSESDIREYAKYNGTGTNPNHKYAAITNWTVKYEKIEKVSYNNKTKYGNKFIGFNTSISQMNIRNIPNPGQDAGGEGTRFSFNNGGEFSLELFGFNISMLSFESVTKSSPKSNEKDKGDSRGHIESNWGIDFSWDPNTKSIEAGIYLEFPISSGQKLLNSFPFQAGPVPIVINIYGGYNLSIKVNIAGVFPLDLPFYPSFKMGFSLNAGLFIMITGGVGSEYFNIGVYGKLTIIDGFIAYNMELGPRKDDNGNEISPRTYGQITHSIGYKLQLLSGELGFQATIPWLKWCYGILPCGIEPKVFMYPIFNWNGICALGDTSKGGCDSMSVELLKYKWQ